MSTSDCTDICEIIMARLFGLGFTAEEIGMDDEDHDKMIEALGKTELVREEA